VNVVSQFEWQQIVARVATGCAEAGLDLVHAFEVARYNSLAPETAQLSDFGRASALGILIGNTRKLWPHFVHAFATDPALTKSDNPLDDYVAARLAEVVAQATERATRLVLAHVTEPRAFPIQRLAELVGFAAFSPTHLAIHPLHGPWLALRALVVFDVPGPDAPLPEPARPCRNCSAPCVPALERAVAVSGTPLASTAIAEHAAEWIAVRDACPVGKGSRYSDAQLSYHYAPARSRIGLG
jgi:methylmalonic aciduria homocystinuria type C protein